MRSRETYDSRTRSHTIFLQDHMISYNNMSFLSKSEYHQMSMAGGAGQNGRAGQAAPPQGGLRVGIPLFSSHDVTGFHMFVK